MALKLYCFGESGNAYKAALALELAGLGWQAVGVDFFSGEARSDSFRQMNEMAEIPLLEAGNGLRLSQSGAIQQWVVDQSGKLGGSPDDRYEVLRWQFFDNHKLSSQAGTVRFLMSFLPEEKRAEQEPVIRFLRARLASAYKVLDQRLADREWIVGEEVTIADLSCCGYLFYNEPFGFDRKDWPHIDAWLDRIAALPGWKHPYDLMPPARPENRKG